MKKIVWNSIFATLLGTLALCAVLVLACVFFFPPTVMQFAYNVGWENTAMRYAEKSYDRFGDAYYLSFAMEVALETEDYEKVEFYGDTFLAHEDFEEFCIAKDAESFYVDEDGNRTDEKLQSTYEQHVYVSLCTAKYLLGKADEAVNLSWGSLHGKFPPNNACAAVLLYALRASDAATAQKVSAKIQTIDEATLSSIDREYLLAMKNLLAAFITP